MELIVTSFPQRIDQRETKAYVHRLGWGKRQEASEEFTSTTFARKSCVCKWVADYIIGEVRGQVRESC